MLSVETDRALELAERAMFQAMRNKNAIEELVLILQETAIGDSTHSDYGPTRVLDIWQAAGVTALLEGGI